MAHIEGREDGIVYVKPSRDCAAHGGFSRHELRSSHHRGLTGCPERARARAEIHESGSKERGGTDLPTGFAGESRNLHPVWGTSGARGGRTVGGGEVIALACSAGELDGQAVALELGAVC